MTTYEIGLDRGMLYPANAAGVAWSGLISVNDQPESDDTTPRYYDGVKYVQRRLLEGFKATLEAFMYPLEFEPYDGYSDLLTAQDRPTFGLSYRTMADDEGAYKIHLVYNAIASPSARHHASLNDTSTTAPFSWDISTTPIVLDANRWASHLVIDSRYAYSSTMTEMEDLLYGENGPPRLPLPSEVLSIFEQNSIVIITDFGDGTWSAEGPDEAVNFLDSTSFFIDWPSAVYIDAVSYSVHSL